MARANSDLVPTPSAAGRPAKSTSRRAVELLLASGAGFREPTKMERQALLVGFAMRGKVLYGAAYDLIRLSEPIDLIDPSAIAEHSQAIIVYEIKSTNRSALGPDLKGYFFNITTAELLVAQNLGAQYRFAFVNIVSGQHLELSLSEIYSRARAIYPAWHIRF